MLTHDQANALVRPLPEAIYGCDYLWRDIEVALTRYQEDWGLNLAPDYQRGHVWSPEQQARFIESVMRRVIPHSGMVIRFNCPHWTDDHYAGELPRELQIMDGLQRLTAIRQFMAGQVRPFGLSLPELARTDFDPCRRNRFMLRFEVYSFATRRQLLQHYLDINTGGTPHSVEEVSRVKAMLATAASDIAL